MRAAAVVLLLALAPAAWADGDPPSDVLLTQDTYLPYAPVSAKLKAALERTVKAARAAGYPMKVALVADQSDLGSYPNLFNQPAQYSSLLTQELSTLNPHGDPLKAVHLLIVMPGGFGGSNLGDGVDKALGPITIGQRGADDLAQAAMTAVARVATANGHRVAVPPEASARVSPGAKKSGGGTSGLVFLAPALVLFAGLFLAGRIASRRRQT